MMVNGGLMSLPREMMTARSSREPRRQPPFRYQIGDPVHDRFSATGSGVFGVVALPTGRLTQRDHHLRSIALTKC